MKILSLGKIDKNIIPIFIGCIICFLNRATKALIFQKTILYGHSIIVSTYIAFSKLFTLLPYIIYIRRTNETDKKMMKNNNINKDISISSTHIQLIYENPNYDNIQGKTKYLFLSAIIFFIQSFLYFATYQIKSNSWIWDILITSTLYYLIFKIKLYKHHYLSVLLILLIGLIIDLVSNNIQNDVSNHFLYLLLRFLREILYSFHDVILMKIS